jgi:hypothetical protein
MDTREATKTSALPELRGFAPKTVVKSAIMPDSVTTKDGTFEIRSEAHGPHWVAWLARTSEGGPERSVLLVGQTQAEAEARARKWGESGR